MIREIVIIPIRIYQRTVSPDHGLTKKLFPYGYCKYHPSCSEYAVRAIRQKGVLKGITLSLYRIGRCNPFSKGGIDLSCDNSVKEAK
jgi:putative membrane protein insertion efficiency factor